MTLICLENSSTTRPSISLSMTEKALSIPIWSLVSLTGTEGAMNVDIASAKTPPIPRGYPTKSVLPMSVYDRGEPDYRDVNTMVSPTAHHSSVLP